MVDDKSTITIVSPQSLHFAKTQLSHMSDSEEDDEEYYQVYLYIKSISYVTRTCDSKDKIYSSVKFILSVRITFNIYAAF